MYPSRYVGFAEDRLLGAFVLARMYAFMSLGGKIWRRFCLWPDLIFAKVQDNKEI